MNQISDIDPNVKLPAAVRAAAARSDEIVKAMQAGQAPEVTTEGNGVNPPELEASNLLQPNETTLESAPAAEPAAADPNDQTWEHKYNSVNGRYTRSQKQIRDMAEQIQNLQQIIANLQVTQQSAPIPDFQIEKLVTEDEERDYGSDFLNVVGKKAKEELAPVIKAYESKISDLEKKLQGVHGVVAQDAQTKMLSDLDDKLPTWRDLNYDKEFLDWLALPDPFSGVIRHDMLKAAYAQGSSSRVLAFFNGFLAEEAAVAPANVPDVGDTQVVPKVPLSSLAAPGRAKTTAASAPVEKPIFTRAQIAQFYTDIAANKYKGRDAEKNKLETQIFDAQREGRIR